MCVICVCKAVFVGVCVICVCKAVFVCVWICIYVSCVMCV